MENLYWVDVDDSVVGPMERDRAHAKGVRHRAGVVFVIRSDGRILLQKRSPSKEIFPDSFECSCAFHVRFGESYEEAARRELLEETGISGMVEFVGKFLHKDPPENQIVAVFKCKSDEPTTIDKSEATSLDAYSKSEVDRIIESRNITPWLRDGWKIVRAITTA